jgi:hypothetical protein
MSDENEIDVSPPDYPGLPPAVKVEAEAKAEEKDAEPAEEQDEAAAIERLEANGFALIHGAWRR